MASKRVDDLIARAEQIMGDVIDGLDLPPADLPDDLKGYKPIAAFTSEAVKQATNEWGALQLSIKVNGETKWSAMRTTDYPGTRLAFVCYAPVEDDDVDR